MMMKVRPMWKLIFVLIVMSLLLVACASNQSENDETHRNENQNGQPTVSLATSEEKRAEGPPYDYAEEEEAEESFYDYVEEEEAEEEYDYAEEEEAGEEYYDEPEPFSHEVATSNNATSFESYGQNPFVSAAIDPLSTFAIDVDTGSYSIMRRYLAEGYLPPQESVRIEEYVNYFDLGYDIPDNGAFGVYLDGVKSPYNAESHIVRVGVQGYDVPAELRTPVTLIFVIDVSGSMAGRLALVKESLTMLVRQLHLTDRVGIVVYGSNARVVLPPTPISSADAINRAINLLTTEGATNADEGIMLGYELARNYARENDTTRLILASDGVANVGETTAEAVLRHAEEGVYLNTYGYGMSTYNDVFMEQLANQGNGAYAYIDSIDEAERVFAANLTSNLFTIAKDAKIQVDFNPSVVSEYRLLGYENRDVADSDFRNDDVDAGEIGAGHSVTALYEVILQPGASTTEAALTARVRFEDPDSGEIIEIAQTFASGELSPTMLDADPHLQLAIIVAEYAEVMRGSYWSETRSFDVIYTDALRISEYFPLSYDVQEFVQLVGMAKE